MIRVTLELISAKDRSRDRLLGVGYISNQGQVGTNLCDYLIVLSKNLPGRTGETWKRGRAAIDSGEILLPAEHGEVPAFDNVKRGAWDLLYLALKAIVGARNPS